VQVVERVVVARVEAMAAAKEAVVKVEAKVAEVRVAERVVVVRVEARAVGAKEVATAAVA